MIAKGNLTGIEPGRFVEVLPRGRRIVEKRAPSARHLAGATRENGGIEPHGDYDDGVASQKSHALRLPCAGHGARCATV